MARGVYPSEALFVYATIGDHRPPQILESGRALGRSTELLGHCYPDIPVVSFEFAADHPDATAAVERLWDMTNVSCLFGDSRVLLPALARPGDVIVIDGPKGLRALKLALALLAEGAPHSVFIHDCDKGSLIRRHLDRHVPHAFFSDDPRFVARYCHLDGFLGPEVLAQWSDPATQPTDRSYGGTFACVPPRPGFPSPWDRLRLHLSRFGANVRQSVGKRARSDS